MAAQNKKAEPKNSVSEVRKPKRASAKSLGAKEERKRVAQLQQLEKKIAELEAQLSEISSALANPPRDAGEVVRLAKEYDRVQKEMDTTMAEWEGMQG